MIVLAEAPWTCRRLRLLGRSPRSPTNTRRGCRRRTYGNVPW